MSSLSASFQSSLQSSSSQQVASSSVRSTKISSRTVRSSEDDSSSRLAIGGDSDYESRYGLGGGSSLAEYDREAFRGDAESGEKSRSQRLKDIMAEAESDMDAMLARSKDARNAAEAAGDLGGRGSRNGMDDDDINLPGRRNLGQEDPEPKNEMERRINLRSKALQRQLPRYV